MAQARHIAKRPGSYLASQVDDELILVHAASGAFFALRDSGLDIWSEIDRTGNLDEIVTALCENYAVGESECRNAVHAFAAELVEAGFATMR